MTPKLTYRQIQVVQLLAQGYSNEGIARRIGLSQSMVRQHVAKIYQRYGITPDPEYNQRVQLVLELKETP